MQDILNYNLILIENSPIVVALRSTTHGSISSTNCYIGIRTETAKQICTGTKAAKQKRG